MEREGYTRFPFLHATSRPRDPTSGLTEESLSLPSLPEDAYLVSWARLLQAYTGQKRVTFASNEEHVAFGDEDDAEASRIVRKKLSGRHDSELCNATGVFFDQDGPSGLELRLSVNRETLSAKLISTSHVPHRHMLRLSEQFQSFLRQSFPGQCSVLDKEQGPTLSILNFPPTRLAGPDLLHELINLSSGGSRIAVDHLESGGTRISVTYHELLSKARLMASNIKAKLENTGRRQRAVVPVLLSQAPALYWTLIGILQADCAFCPLNLDAPEERIRFIVEDVSAPLLVTESALLGSIPKLDGVHVLCIDALDEMGYPALPAFKSKPDDAAYIMYTSGSTGAPKGVELSHLAVAQSLQAHQPHIPAFSRFLQFAAPTFDVSMFEIFFTLLRGATIVSCDRQHLLNNLAAVINDMDVDAAELTPTVAGSLLPGREGVPNLRVLLTIGEMLTASVIQEYGGGSLHPGVLHGMYGPTEAAIHCTLESDFDAQLRPGIIGQPLETVSSFIVTPSPEDEREETALNIVPIGFTGELAVGGAQLATGYLNRPEQNMKSYYMHPTYGRLYRTGDKARMLPDGRIECLGRIGVGQVKLRGQRIELGEIEHIALQETSCRVSVALVVDGSLVLFCAGESAVLTGQSILERCRKALPKFMVPADIQILSVVPQLPSGKVDKRKLEQEYRESVQHSDELGSQNDENLENQLSQAISEYTGRTVRPLTKLSESGIDSLRAIQVASRLRQAGWEISAADILTSRNVAHLSFLARERTLTAPTSESEPTSDVDTSQVEEAVFSHCSSIGVASDIERVFLCTPIQLSMLAETAVRPDAYFNTFTFEILGQPIDHVTSCIRDLAATNPILRSGFCELETTRDLYALVQWKSLEPYQVNFNESKDDNDRNILRPLRISLKRHTDRIHAVFSIHHALYDGWSVDLILEELSLRLRKKTPPIRHSYGAICEIWAKSGRSYPQADRIFWERQMQDFTIQSLSNLSGTTAEDGTMYTCSRNLSASPGEFRKHAEQARISKQSFAAAALAYLLTSYHGSDDVTFAIVTSGRTKPIAGIENMVGPCLATLPFRISVDQTRSALELLQHVHRHSRSIVNHDSIDLGEIKKLGGIAAGDLICDVLFIWQETLLDHAMFDDTIRIIDNNDELEFKLVVEIEPRADTIGIKLRYARSLFSQEHAQLILAQLDQVVNALLYHQDTPVRSLSSYLDPNILAVENAEPVANTFNTSLASAVEAHAEARPHEAALMFYSALGLTEETFETVTYSQLNSRANALASRLQENGVLPDDLVVLCLEKSVFFYIAVLAVLKAGAGYVPITPVTPRDRILGILNDSKPRLCIISSSARENWPTDSSCQTLMAEAIKYNASVENLAAPYVGHHAAYAVYTSGSTGTPKGLLVTQDNLQSNLKELAALYPNHPKDRLLQSCSQAFDVSVFEIFFTWQQGLCLCSAANDDIFRDLEYAVRSMRITHLSLTPSVAALIDPVNVPEVRFLITAGEAVTEQVFRRWAGRRLLWQGYGPAETVNICTVKPNVAANDSINNIGRPLPNTSVLILHPDSLEVVPRGGVGELCFGGDQVCRGYINRASLTAEKFVQHPRYGRIYRSGDLGRLLTDGDILFVGRADDQVKIRGQRIELGEINSVIMDQSFVKDCASLVVTSSRRQTNVLVVFWVPKRQLMIDEVEVNRLAAAQKARIELFSAMRAYLPAYMIPSNLIMLPKLPRTAQGKIDKRGLQEHFESLDIEELQNTYDDEHQRDDSISMSELENTIAEALSSVLQISHSEIRRHSAFFSFGLDSLSAIRLSKALRNLSGHTVDVSTILKHPSVCRLAEVISKMPNGRKPGPESHRTSQLLPENVTEEVRNILTAKSLVWRDVLPCTPLQVSMLSAAASSSSTAYCNYVNFRLISDPAPLKAAMLEVVKRHDIFRTAFVPTTDMREPFVQVILTQTKPFVLSDDMDLKASQGDTADKLRAHVIENLHTLQPPYSIFFETKGHSNHLHMVLHHSLYDGIAADLIFDEIENLCRGINLPEPPNSNLFLQEVVRQQSDEAIAFWVSQLDDSLPAEFPRSEATGPEPRSHLAYSKASSAKSVRLELLESGCRKLNVTVSAAVQTAWAKVLSMYIGSADVCFGKVVSGRHLPIDGLDRLVAPCFNTVPVRADLSVVTNLSLLENLQQLNVDTLPYSLTSLRRIQNVLDLKGSSLLDSIVLLQESEREIESSLWEMTTDDGTMDFPLVLEIIPRSSREPIGLILHYASNFLLPDDAHNLVSMFSAALQDCIEFPEADARSIGLHEESASILRDLNKTPLSLSLNELTRGEIPKALETKLRKERANLSEHAQDEYREDHVVVVDIAGNLLPLGFVGELCLTQDLNGSRSLADTRTSISRCGIMACLSSRKHVTVVSVTDAVVSAVVSAVRELPGIADAALCRSGRRADPFSVFVHVGNQHGHDMERRVLEILETFLPSSLIPDHVSIVRSIHYTKAGQVHVKRLLTEAFTEQHANLDEVITWTDTAVSVRAAYQKVCRRGQDEIGPLTSIFKLGIDSIGAIQVATLLRASHPSVTAADVLEQPTCSDLARVLEARKQFSKADTSTSNSTPKSFDRKFRSTILRKHDLIESTVDLVLPCTQMQSGLLAASLRTAGRVYVNHICYEFPLNMPEDKIEKAWAQTVHSHQMLRTGFSQTEMLKIPFAMICYGGDLSTRKWVGEVDIATEEWRKASLEQMSTNLHEPQWRALVKQTPEAALFHVLMHHAIYDARSLDIISTTFQKALEGVTSEEEPSILPAISSIMGNGTTPYNEQEEFWIRECASMSIQKFPNMSPLKVRTATWRQCEAKLSMSLRQLESACEKVDITIQAAAQAAYAAVLAAYSGEASVTFGVVLSGRETESANTICFPHVVTVPFTCNTADGKSALLKQSLGFGASVRRHMFLPLTTIQRIAGSGNQQLFDTVFVYQRQSSINEARLRHNDVESITEYPVSLELEVSDGSCPLLRLTYNAAVLPVGQAELLLQQFNAILRDLLGMSDAGSEFEETSLISYKPAEIPTIPSPVRLLHEWVELQASQYPDRPALEFARSIDSRSSSRKCWSYANLDAQSNLVANKLRQRGTIIQSKVAICFDKCAEASLATVGILKAGCAFVAIDPNAPPDRIRFILEDSGSVLVLSHGSIASQLASITPLTVLDLEDPDFWKDEIFIPSAAPATPSDVCYCLYTSGTTGTPKGCEITHENVVQALQSFQRLFHGHWDNQSRWLQFASFHFDVSVLEQFWSWSVGICVVSAPRDVIFEDMPRAIRELGITHIDLTPSLAKLVTPTDVPSLCKGVFITGGEKLQQEVLDTWGPLQVIYNGYGPTEATIGVTMYPRVPENGKPSNIGWQFDNVGTVVLTPGTDRPVIRGGVGELCVTGKLVGKGYLSRPELTSQRFPVLDRWGGRAYRTGDLVRMLHDDSFDFVGRIDDQVKLRGQRLEIGEINHTIKSAVPAIKDLATLVVLHPSQKAEQLVCFLSTAEGNTRSETVQISTESATLDAVGKASEACRSKLPPYMVPSQFIGLNRLPLSANNKSDGNALKKLYSTIGANSLHQRLQDTENEQHSLTANELEVATKIAEFVKLATITDIRSSSTLYELGLDSITLLGLSKKLKTSGYSRATVSLLSEHPTIRSLSRALKSDAASDKQKNIATHAAKQHIRNLSRRGMASICASLSITSSEIEQLAPCTPLQQGIISRALESTRSQYYVAFYFRLPQDTCVQRLQRAWLNVHEKLPILRTQFLPTDDGYMQVVRRSISLPWKTETFSGVDDLKLGFASTYKDWISANTDHIVRPFEVVMFDRSGTRTMALHLFHALYDATSLDLLLNAVASAYHGEHVDCGPSFFDCLPHGPLRNSRNAKEFWIQHLKDSVPAGSQTTYPDTGTIVQSALVDNLDSLERRRVELSVTKQALLQACWITTLAAIWPHSKTSGLITSGRSIDFPEVEQVIGPMFNTLPFYMSVRGLDTWRDVITACHDFNREVLPFQHTSLRDIQRWVRLEAGGSLFDNILVFQRHAMVGQEVRPWELIHSHQDADYPLACEVEEIEHDALRITLVASSTHATNDKIELVLSTVRGCLNAMLTNPDGRLDETVDVGSDTTGAEPSRQEMQNGHPERPDHTKSDVHDQVVDLVTQEIAALSGADAATIDMHRSILELGLDSIDAIKLSSRLSRKLQRITVSQIMKALTVQRITDILRSSQSIDEPKNLSDRLSTQSRMLYNILIRTHDGEDGVPRVLPTSPLQDAMVAAMQASNLTTYFNHDVLRLERGINAQRLLKAIGSVVEATPILRTTFEAIDDPAYSGAFAQVVHPAGVLSWDRSPTAPVKSIEELVSAGLGNISDDDSNPSSLFYASIVSTEGRQYLLLSIAHALYDGWCLSLLHQDIRLAYDGYSIDRIAYDDTLAEITANAADTKAAEFWKTQLQDVSPSVLPAHANNSVDASVVCRLEHTSASSAAKIRAFCKDQNVTSQSLTTTCWAVLLAHRLHNLEVVFGMVLSGRDTPDANEVMFPTMNTVAFSCYISGAAADLARQTQDDMAAVREHQHFPLAKAKQFARSADQALFNTLFIYQARPALDGTPKVPLYTSEASYSTVDIPVCVEAEVQGDELVWRIACEDNILDEVEAKTLLRQLDSVLGRMLRESDTDIIEAAEDGFTIAGLPAINLDEVELPSSPAADGDTMDDGGEETPWTETEKAVSEIISKIAQVPVDSITRQTTLYHVGLDSISAIKVSRSLREQNLKLTVTELLRFGSIRKISEHLDAAGGSNGNNAAVADRRLLDKDNESPSLTESQIQEILSASGIPEQDIQKVQPATAGQTYMLATWVASNGALFYPEFNYVLQCRPERNHLADAWSTLCQENPMLRTCFVTTRLDDTPFASILLKQASASTNLASSISMSTSKLTQPFVTLSADFQDSEWHLTLKIHHALYDGVTLPGLFRRLELLCRTQSPELAPASDNDVAILGSISKPHVSSGQFWQSYLSDASPATLGPLSWESGRVESFHPRVVDDLSDLRRACSRIGVSIHAAFLAAYARLYARIAHVSNEHNDVLLGVYLANRSHGDGDFQGTPVPTVNLLPLRVRQPTERGLADIARDIQRDLQQIGRFENCFTSLWQIYAWTDLRVDTFVNFLDLPIPADQSADSEDRSVSPGLALNGKRREAYCRLVETDAGRSWSPPTALMGCSASVRDAYIPSLDVEAAIVDGALDVGIFGPEAAMGGNDGVKDLVNDIRHSIAKFDGSR